MLVHEGVITLGCSLVGWWTLIFHVGMNVVLLCGWFLCYEPRLRVDG
ncbi:Cathepsin C exclusion domain-containing protein [Dioscorea alata]|uniref:Cathepsin C exclusion domain-containing protein n=1 Tax=Dioscorea alata TaxID=55571 RepID=A0ACB7URA0_DIOAL|nr:Cathepsin C exclusion domain-containing protein [Dioscorea alata]